MSKVGGLLAVVPAVLLASGPPAVARAAIQVIDAHASYPEGPVWAQGRLFYVEYAAARVDAWDGTERRVHWSDPHCGPSGLIAFGENHLLVACYDNNTVVELAADGKPLRVFERDASGKPFTGPNDFTGDGAGGVYFTASGVYDVKAPITGAVLHLTAGGESLTEVANLIHYPNGLALTPDGKTLLVAEHLAARILSFPVHADGTLGSRSVWARLQDLAPAPAHADAYTGPDGIKFAPDGTLYVAQNGAARVLVVSPAKQVLRIIKVPTPFVSNVGFGADGAATLYITGSFDQWKAPYPGVVYRWTVPLK